MNKRALYELMPRSMRQNKDGISSFTVSIPTETKQYAKRPFKRLVGKQVYTILQFQKYRIQLQHRQLQLKKICLIAR